MPQVASSIKKRLSSRQELLSDVVSLSAANQPLVATAPLMQNRHSQHQPQHNHLDRI